MTGMISCDMIFITWFNERTRLTKSIICVALSAVVAWGDFLTGSELSIGAFYLFPVFLMAWTVSCSGAVALSVADALSWTVTDVLTQHAYSSAGLQFWNTAVRVVYLLGAAYVVGRTKKMVEVHTLQARQDALTSLPNRRAFMEALERECLRGARGTSSSTLAFIDLDNFKFINDRFGHQVGDQVLKVVGQILLTRIRRKMDLAARLGGDEFVILLSGTDQQGAEKVLGELRERLLKAMQVHHWPVTFSIGCITSMSTYSANDLMARADRLMYAVKQRTKGDINYALTTGENFTQGTQTI